MWYKAQLKDKKVEVDIFDEIGGFGVTAENFRDDVKALLDEHNYANELHINLNSPGGSVFDGIAIHNFIAGLNMKTVIKIDALAASIATVIALGADEVHMNQNAFFMIHNPWTVVMGEADEMRKQAEVMDKIKDVIVGIYLRKTRMSRAELSDLMDNETWLTAEEARRMNFIDVVSGGLAIAACSTTGFINNFNNIPKSLKMAEELENVSNELEVTNEVETTEVEETVEETVEEVTNETEEVENVEETESTEETTEVEEVQEETILNKVKSYLANLISENRQSEELSDRYGEVSNELKDANNLIEDLKAENVEKDEVLNQSLEAIKNLESKNSDLAKEVKELKAKLEEPVGEELVATPVNESKKEVKSFKDTLAQIKNNKK